MRKSAKKALIWSMYVCIFIDYAKRIKDTVHHEYKRT